MAATRRERCGSSCRRNTLPKRKTWSTLFINNYKTSNTILVIISFLPELPTKTKTILKKHSYILSADKDIRYHINRFCNIGNKLREMGSPVPHHLLMNKITSLLPGPYQQFRARWRDTPAASKTIESMTQRLIAEEELIKCYTQPEPRSNIEAYVANGILFILQDSHTLCLLFTMVSLS